VVDRAAGPQVPIEHREFHGMAAVEGQGAARVLGPHGYCAVGQSAGKGCGPVHLQSRPVLAAMVHLDHRERSAARSADHVGLGVEMAPSSIIVTCPFIF